jgi:hypothetical protein
MRPAVQIAWITAVAAACLSFSHSHILADDVILADWENNGPTGMGGAGTDFDTAPIDGTPSCTGCWLKGNAGVMSTLSQSTIGATRGNSSLRIEMVGKGTGGGEALADTHFDLGARVLWSSAQMDPRFAAIQNAVNGNQGLFTVEFDVTYDIPALRAVNWLGPPVDFPAKPVNFIGLGIYGNTNNDGGGFEHAALEQILPTLINPNAPEFNGITNYTVHVSVPLERFTFTANPANPPTFYEMGFSLNGNWGTLPAANNLQAASFYVDNMVLAEFDPVEPVDFNNNGMADVGDWVLFMGQHLVANPTLGDLVGNFGASGTNGKNDFHDLLEFQRLYDLANGGAGSLASALEGVPEPGSHLLILTAFVLSVFSTIGRNRAIRFPIERMRHDSA